MSHAPSSTGSAQPADPALPAGFCIEAIAAFRDNYIWLLERDGHAVVVDPGDAGPVIGLLEQRNRKLDAIVVTHHHADHVGGVVELARRFGAPVYGPANSPFPGIDQRLREDQRICLLGEDFSVREVPGHTLDHIAYWSPALAAVFCGDTLFACGCGRLFEGTAVQMFDSLGKLARLPDETRVYCAHEYTSANIDFARQVEPSNPALQQRSRDCDQMRDRGMPTVPSVLALEKATNPFLRCDEPTVRAALERRGTRPAAHGAEAFAALRSWKDMF